MAKKYFDPLPGSEVPSGHRNTFAKYRALAIGHGVEVGVPLCYRVRDGFSFKTHAPKAGPCYENLRYLKKWKFEDKPTTDCLVFWVPRLINGSNAKTVDGQKRLLSDLRQELELPEHHFSGFGQVSLVSGLILAHFKATAERIPVDMLCARTDTCCADGRRLFLGLFDEHGLDCGYWGWDGDCGGDFGVFALGIEPLA